MIKILNVALVVVFLAACSLEKKPDAAMSVVEFSSPADSLTAEPYLFTDSKGNVLLSWIEKQKDTSRFWFSRLSGTTWSTPTLIAKGSTWFVNWADYPMISSDGGANYVAHLLEKSGKSTYAYDVNVYLSNDSGKTWKSPFVLHDDGKQAEHGFVTLVPYGEKIFVSWLDGRNTAMEGMESMDHSGHHGAMSLRAAVIDYQGNKSGEWELDNKTCDCCQTTAAVTDHGPIVIYRDRTDAEIRDLSIVRYVNGQWTAPTPVHTDNWKIAGCPVNGPRVSVNGDRVAIAWFTGATEPAHVNVIFSEDGGATFGEAMTIDEGQANGRVDIEWIDEHRCVVSWMEGALIKAAIVHLDGERESVVTIASSSEARSSGFPQMTRTGNRLVFAWTDDASKRVRVASISL